ncbi:MAG TPA: hypothetical protein D7I06_04335 [Candidatus Poseidoniales archaeon]|nr:MAG TPA: hypothetical protein D7I06_04335 [Candidatus Poseidoniales archaeon]HII62817.1 hypothetical protein [Candidatus Poseidoniaceae archaeon]|tara:strand:- start:341 stop:583 length:243 start_codon:yes stop_codon:yes gene_type:complete
MALSDHQERESFTYDRSWKDIENMLDKAETAKNRHHMAMMRYRPKSKEWVYHARNFKALEGVVKSLRWTLGDKNVDHPLE